MARGTGQYVARLSLLPGVMSPPVCRDDNPVPPANMHEQDYPAGFRTNPKYRLLGASGLLRGGIAQGLPCLACNGKDA